LKVRAKYFGVIREITGKREETFEVSTSVSLLDLLRILAVNYGSKMGTYLLDLNTNTARPIHLYILNGKAFTASQTSTTVLREGDVVSIVPTQGG